MTKIKLILAIYGDLLDPQHFSKLSKITPTSFWLKGDIISKYKTKPTRKETCWEYSSEFMDLLYLEELTNVLCKKFNPTIKETSDYIDKNNLETKLDIVIEIINPETPVLYFNREFIELIAKMKGEIDIDMYLLNE